MFPRFRQYLTRADGRTAGAIVLMSAVVLAYFFGRTFVEPLPRQYQLDFGNAKWIQAPGHEASGYFRKTLYISAPLNQAWISLSATGNYKLTINDIILDAVQYPGARPSGIYDIKQLISPGKNVIAVYVAGGQFPGPVQLRVRGSYAYASSPEVQFLSDSTWKVSGTPDGIVSSLPWSSQGLDDTLWTNAIETKNGERFATVLPVASDPRLIEHPPIGDWIGAPQADAADVTFTYEFDSHSSYTSSWLQLASTGAYDLLVNGRPVALESAPNRASIFGPQAPIALPGSVIATSSQLPAIIVPASGLPGSSFLSIATRASSSSIASPGTSAGQTGASGTSSPQTGTSSASASATLTHPAAAPLGGQKSGAGKTSSSGSSTSQLSSATTTSAGATGVPLTGKQSSSQASSPQSASSSQTVASPSSGNQSSTSTVIGPANVTMDEVLQIPDQTDAGGLSRLDLVDISPPTAPVSPQLVAQPGSFGFAQAALTLTAFDVSEWVHAGTNIIEVRIHSGQGPALLLADGLIDSGAGRVLRIGTDQNWSALVSARGESNGKPLPAVVVAGFAGMPWGPLPQIASYSNLLPGQDLRIILRWSATMVLTVALTVALWIFAAPAFVSDREDLVVLWNHDAIAHLPILVVLVGLWLFCFDVRIPYDWCFRPLVIVVIVAALILNKVLLLGSCFVGRPQNLAFVSLDSIRHRWRWQPIALGCIVIAAFLLRAWGLTATPMGHDETAMAMVSKGVLKVGFPYATAGSYTRWMSTYELVPYPLALSSLIFGATPLGYRVPALLFGTLTVGLVGLVGYRMMSWRVGLVSAFIYAFMAIPLNWSQDGFYLTQEGFFSLLTIWLFYEAIRDPGIHRRYLTYAAVGFILTYLSWEGSGFILPTLVIAILVLKWGDFAWMKDPYLLTCFLIVAALVIFQLCFRQLVMVPDYLGAVKDLSELTTPEFVLLDRIVFDPLFYVRNLFFADNFGVLTVLFIAGIVFVRRNQPLLYLYIFVGMLYLWYSYFLAHYAPRYYFNWISLLVLGAVGTYFYFWDRIAAVALARRFAILRTTPLYAGLVIVILSANPFALKLYRMTLDSSNPAYFNRLGVAFKPDYRGADIYVATHWSRGDLVITMVPHVYLFDTGRWPDYSINTMLSQRITYDGGAGHPMYIDKWLGVENVRSLNEIEALNARYKRIWFIQRTEQTSAPDVKTFLAEKGKVVYEGVLQEVILLPGTAPLSPTEGPSAAHS